MHFGGMRHPPFDTEEGRAGLPARLNEIDGIDLSPSAIRGWPRFALSVLERPDALARLVGVLGRIANETGQPGLSIPAREQVQQHRTMQDGELVRGEDERGTGAGGSSA